MTIFQSRRKEGPEPKPKLFEAGTWLSHPGDEGYMGKGFAVQGYVYQHKRRDFKIIGYYDHLKKPMWTYKTLALYSMLYLWILVWRREFSVKICLFKRKPSDASVANGEQDRS